MAIAFVRTTNGTSGSSTSLSADFDATDCTTIVVSVIGDVSGTNNISGITYNGVSLTKINEVQIPSDRILSLWYLHNPTTGVNSLTVSSSPSGFIQWKVAGYSGTDTTATPTANSTGTASSSSTISTSLSIGTADSWEIWGCASAAGNLTTGTGYTVRGTSYGGVLFSDSGTGLSAGTNNVTLTFSSSSNHASIFASFAPAAASGPANLKSLDTNVKANIKSYNTNVLANIKSINTNA